MKGLLEFPDDVKLKILEVSDPQDLRTCQQVCRALYNLTVSSPQIQYILTLDTLGYTVPSTPRLDLTLHQKIEFLERHRRNWSCPDTCQPTEYQLHEIGVWRQFNGGVYACALLSDTNALPWHQSIKGLHFYQLPSSNLALEFREWCIPDLGLSARGFAIDTAQDLLILVELADPSRSWSEGCLIHLRTMSENSQHPKAAVPVLLAEFAQSEGDLGSRRNAPILMHTEVAGNLLAILFKSRTQHMTSWVIVWDWNRGVEVTRISTGTGSSLGSFTLLSEDKLLLPRCSNSYYVGEDVPGDTFGSLDIYVFDPHGTTSAPPRMIASFGLPNLETGSCKSELHIVSNQRFTPSSAYTDMRPKVYDLVGRDRLIAVNVWLRSFPGASLRFDTGLLYIPTRVLLHTRQDLESVQGVIVANGDVTKVPWDDWAHLTHWIECDPSLGGCVYSQRIVASSRWDRDDEGDQAMRELLLLDFNQRRFGWAKSVKENETRKLDIMSGRTTSVDLGSRNAFGKDTFRGARTQHIRWTLRMWSGSDQAAYDRLLIDDEHVIVEKVDFSQDSGIGAKQSLLVYTF